MEEYDSYEIEIGSYETARGEKAVLAAVVEFEEDPELGFMASFYASAAGVDCAFFSESIFQNSENPDLTREEWMDYCAELAKEKAENGEIDFGPIRRWLDTHRIPVQQV